MKETKEKAITLVALVITIIVLLILAGITINALSGENGLITKTKLAKKKYEISETKEKIEMVIMTLRIEEEGKGESLTKEDLPKINSDEIDVRSVESFPVEVISNGYKFNIDENFKVTYVGEANETVITYITEPEGYTNKDEVSILLKFSSPIGIKRVEYPKGESPLIGNGEKEFALDYKVTANGTYTFKVIDNKDNEVTKDVVIDKIDKLEPLDFTPTVEEVKANSLVIKANAKDAESDETNTKSGIWKYEYYIKEENSDKYNKYESTEEKYTVIGLNEATEYSIYVIAYDKAENNKISVEVKQTTKDEEVDYETYINAHMQVDKKIYISSKYGNDSTGNGTQSSPYKTLNKIAEDGIIQNENSYAIVLMNGEYTLTESIYTLNCNKGIYIFGNKRRTILSVTGLFQNKSGGSSNYSVNFYRLVLFCGCEGGNTIFVKNKMSFNNIALIYNFTSCGTAYFIPDVGRVRLR